MPTNEGFLPLEQFNNKIVVKDLTLTPKSFRQPYDVSNAYTTEPTIKTFKIIQDFFNVKKIFEENAWQPEVHKDYEYENFSGKIVKLYSLYSPQVLTYNSLASFLDLIENKFRPIIKEFIPIVINISEFGRLVQNSLFIVPKAHYPAIHNLCNMQVLGHSILQFRIFDYLTAGYDFEVKVKKKDGSSLIPDFNVTWTGTEGSMELALFQKFRNSLVNPYSTYFKTYLNDGILILEIIPEWYYNTFGGNSNDVTIEITQPGLGISGAGFLSSFDYGSFDAENDCGGVQYSIPKIPEVISGIYIYYDAEGKPAKFISYSSESSVEKTYLNYKQD